MLHTFASKQNKEISLAPHQVSSEQLQHQKSLSLAQTHTAFYQNLPPHAKAYPKSSHKG